MRRWNGWGDEANSYPLKVNAKQFLQQRLGSAKSLVEASLSSVRTRVPESRLSQHPLITTDSETRVRHARGQSLPDWLAMRSGEIEVFPDAVAYPITSEDVRELFDYAELQDALLIPYGGGTSVAGHINPPASDKPVLTVDMGRMNQLLNLDEHSQIATFGAGVAGPDLEAQLRARGYTLGHFPQSFELSTLGGWVASRSSGQQSMRYGRIEQLFAGGRVETPQGSLEIPSFPASSAGLDIREMLLGSEGRMGILTEVKVRVTRLPEQEHFYVAFVPDWPSAEKLARKLVQNKTPLSMLRVSNAVETETHLTLAGHPHLVSLLTCYLNWRGCHNNKCMVTYGVTGSRQQCRSARRQTNRLLRRVGGVGTGKLLGKKWQHSRFRSPYLRETLWELGYVVDTLETATDWINVSPMVESIEQALQDEAGQYPLHVLTHLSHLYAQGSSIYTTYIFPMADSYENTLQRWQCLKSAGSEAVVRNRGTISHQHGVGVDHAPYLVKEKGVLGMSAIEQLCRHFDPQQRMNPGKLIDDAGRSME